MTPRALALVGLLALAGAAAAGAAGPAPFLINETPSLPRGLYLRTAEAPAPGRIVALRPPPVARAYLAGLGAPDDARLLKRVVADEGDRVCRCGDRVSWLGGARTAMSRDRRGRALPAWQGCRRLLPGELLVFGDSPASFDSRYFGPVGVSAVAGVYREVWTW